MKNDLFLKALHCQNHDARPPIWIMRQAGRSLPEYRKLRETHSLNELFHDPKKIAQVTLQPLKRYPLDAAILFADILHILLPLGCNVLFPKGGGIQIDTPKTLQEKDVMTTLSFVKEGIHLLKKQLNIPLIGFCGGPFTVASYLLKRKPEYLLYSKPAAFQDILKQITAATQIYLKMQIDAGVDAIQIFDSWAGTLPRRELETFALPPLKTLIDNIDIPVLVFSRANAFYIKEFISLGSNGISFDGSLPLAEIRKKVPSHIAVQGNLPPEFLYSPIETIREETKKHLASMQGDPGFIVNLGHGILPDTPLEHARAFIETVVNSNS